MNDNLDKQLGCIIGILVVLLAICIWMSIKASDECHKRGGEIIITGQHWQVDVIPDGHGGVVTSGHMAPTYGCSK